MSWTFFLLLKKQGNYRLSILSNFEVSGRTEPSKSCQNAIGSFKIKGTIVFYKITHFAKITSKMTPPGPQKPSNIKKEHLQNNIPMEHYFRLFVYDFLLKMCPGRNPGKTLKMTCVASRVKLKSYFMDHGQYTDRSWFFCSVLRFPCSVLCALCCLLCALCSVLCALCSVLCALCSVLCALSIDLLIYRSIDLLIC